jgi:hypothetical protein
VLLAREDDLNAALKAATALARVQRDDGWLAGTYNERWMPAGTYCCLTGVAQMSIDSAAAGTGDGAVRSARPCASGARVSSSGTSISIHDPAVRGAIAGSAPIWGAYERFLFPNWAAKFFADAVMMDLADVRVPPPLASNAQVFAIRANV